MARPTDYTPEVADEICDKIVKGKSLVRICEEDHMPSPSTVYLWLRKHEEFSENYTRAKEDQADGFADEIIKIADHHEDTQKAKLQIDTRKWVASKFKPKKYGDKQTLEHEGKVATEVIWPLGQSPLDTK